MPHEAVAKDSIEVIFPDSGLSSLRAQEVLLHLRRLLTANHDARAPGEGTVGSIFD